MSKPVDINRFSLLRILSMSIGLLLGISALTGCASWGRKELSEKPKRSSSMPSFQTKPSTIGALATVPIGEISDILNEKIPQEFSDSGNGGDACIQGPGFKTDFPPIDIPGPKVCAGTKYEFTARRAGPVSVSAIGSETLRLTLPIDFSGKGGFRGDGAKLLKLDAKNFKGGVNVTTDLRPRLTSEWCPQLDASVDFSWTQNPKVEIVGGVWVDVRGQVEGKIREKIPELVEKAKSAIDCVTFKMQVAKVYGSRTFPIELADSSKAHVNVLPTDVGFSGLQFEPSLLKAAAIMTASMEVSDKPLTPAVLALPPLRKIPAATPQTIVALPVRVPYETLEGKLNAVLGGKTFTSDTSIGKVSVTANNVEIYPFDKRLAIGVHLKADLPRRWLDTSGTVYLFATPVVEADGVRISITDVGFSRKLDNDFWNAATVLFEGPILGEIKKAATYDLTSDIAKLKAMLTKKLQDPVSTPGMVVTVENVSIRLGRIAVAEKELAVEGLFTANVSIAVNQ